MAWCAHLSCLLGCSPARSCCWPAGRKHRYISAQTRNVGCIMVSQAAPATLAPSPALLHCCHCPRAVLCRVPGWRVALLLSTLLLAPTQCEPARTCSTPAPPPALPANTRTNTDSLARIRLPGCRTTDTNTQLTLIS